MIVIVNRTELTAMTHDIANKSHLVLMKLQNDIGDDIDKYKIIKCKSFPGTIFKPGSTILNQKDFNYCIGLHVASM
jgi:hypothetical protein